MLSDKGYKARALVGGWKAWVDAGGATEKAAEPADYERKTR
jgi:rhodanese-related sulfurtransferase